MDEKDILAKLEALKQERQQVLLDMQFRLGIITGKEQLYAERLQALREPPRSLTPRVA